jgi:hypothetical protein
MLTAVCDTSETTSTTTPTTLKNQTIEEPDHDLSPTIAPQEGTKAEQ